MSRPSRLSLVLLVCLLSARASAAEVKVSLADGKLDLRIEDLQYPTSFPGELTSGLTNRLLTRVSLREGSTLLQQRTAEIAIRYDLWDQTFTATIDMEGKVNSRGFADLAQITAFLAALEVRGAFAAAPLAQDREMRVSVELLLNPIGREKLGMIRKWVAQNSTPQAGGDSAMSSNSELFVRIFEQHADGSQFAAAWRVVVDSKPFRLSALPHEKR